MLGFADQPTEPSGTPESPKAPDKDPLPEAKAPGTPAEGQEEPTVREEANEVLMALAPWGISILFHLGLVLLAIFLAWNTASQKAEEEEIIIPLATLSKTPGAPLTTQTQRTTTTTSSTTRSTTTTSSAAAGPGKASFAGKSGATSSLIGMAGGGGGGGKSSPFGSGTSTGSGLKASFFGSGGNARRLVYLVDASGSLIDTFPFVINELKRSINDLSEQQSFTIIFFQGGDVLEVPPRGLKTANAENKRRVIEWIDPSTGNIIPRGGTTPVKALRLGLQYQPQLMFLLSDNITGTGVFQVDQRRLLADIERANAGGTKINTIQYIYPDPLVSKGLKGTMELISARSGGIAKYIDARDLQIK